MLILTSIRQTSALVVFSTGSPDTFVTQSWIASVIWGTTMYMFMDKRKKNIKNNKTNKQKVKILITSWRRDTKNHVDFNLFLKNNHSSYSSKTLCMSRKYPYFPHRGDRNFLGGRGAFKKIPSGGRYVNFLELHIAIFVSIIWSCDSMFLGQPFFQIMVCYNHYETQIYMHPTLNCFAQEVTTSFLVNHTLVYFACCDIVVSTKSNIQEPFIVAKVQVYLTSII